MDINQLDKIYEKQSNPHNPPGFIAREFAMREIMSKGMVSPLNITNSIQIKSSDGSALSGYDSKLKKNFDKVIPHGLKSKSPTQMNVIRSPERNSNSQTRDFEVEEEIKTGYNSNNNTNRIGNNGFMNRAPSNKKPIKLYDNNKINTRYMMN